MLYSPEEKMLGGLLGAVSDRQQLLANNLANVTTTGYVRRDVDFNTVMRDINSDGHEIKDLDKTIKKAIYQDANGEHPTLEKELAAMYENQVKYILLIRLNAHISKHLGEATQSGRAV